MTQAILYFALGALSVSLLFFAFLPAISRRAQRLAQEDLEQQAPLTFSEIAAQKDQIRARLAVEMNRQDYNIKQMEQKMHGLLVDAERWRVHAERVELDFDRLNDEYNTLRKRLARRERQIDKHREIIEQTSQVSDADDKKQRFALEQQLDALQAEKGKADIKIIALQREVDTLQAQLLELENAKQALPEVSIDQELKDLAEVVSTFVTQAETSPTIPVSEGILSIRSANSGEANVSAADKPASTRSTRKTRISRSSVSAAASPKTRKATRPPASEKQKNTLDKATEEMPDKSNTDIS